MSDQKKKKLKGIFTDYLRNHKKLEDESKAIKEKIEREEKKLASDVNELKLIKAVVCYGPTYFFTDKDLAEQYKNKLTIEIRKIRTTEIINVTTEYFNMEKKPNYTNYLQEDGKIDPSLTKEFFASVINEITKTISNPVQIRGPIK